MKKALLFICLAAFAIIAGCLENPMTMNEALVIARASSCMAVGNLTNSSFFNNETQTWWIDLDTVKPGCAPACVVYLSNKTAEVNWRCTGVIPPENETNPPIGGQTDEHGCLIAAGYSWCEAKQKCHREWEEPCAASINITEAQDIAKSSGCMEVGNLTTQSSYNNYTQTWWIDLDTLKPGCAPACVVFESNKTAEVNWRCTGLIPINATTQCWKPCHIDINANYNDNPPSCLADVVPCGDEHGIADTCLKYINCSVVNDGCATSIDEKFYECVSCYRGVEAGTINASECEPQVSRGGSPSSGTPY